MVIGKGPYHEHAYSPIGQFVFREPFLPLRQGFVAVVFVCFQIGNTEPVDHATLPYLTHTNFVFPYGLLEQKSLSIRDLLKP